MLKYNYCTYKGDNQMTENTYILAVDPGNEKTGVAILSPSGEMICRKIISSNTFNKDIERILTEYLVLFILFVEMVQIINICILRFNKLDVIIKLQLV